MYEFDSRGVCRHVGRLNGSRSRAWKSVRYWFWYLVFAQLTHVAVVDVRLVKVFSLIKIRPCLMVLYYCSLMCILVYVPRSTYVLLFNPNHRSVIPSTEISESCGLCSDICHPSFRDWPVVIPVCCLMVRPQYGCKARLVTSLRW